MAGKLKSSDRGKVSKGLLGHKKAAAFLLAFESKKKAGSAYLANRKVQKVKEFETYHSVVTGVAARLTRTLEQSGLTRDDIRQIIPDRTLDRRIANNENLKIEEADGLARLLRVVTMARRVFEDDALADEWLRSPNPGLADLVPIQMAATDLGGREVEAALGRIEQGVFG